MANVKFENITKTYNKATKVLANINLEIKEHEFAVIVGPSGCGKTTLLRMLAGLEEITSGRILIDGEVINHFPPSKREIAMVFQDYALYPHMSVAENMSFALHLRKFKASEIEKRVKEAAKILQISPYLGRMPRELSGGQRQRVAIGRAIVRKPKVFLFDEPLSNLDAKLREEMRVEIAKLHQKLNSTIIYVTHDQVEAMTLASKIIILNKGVVQQVGTPLEVYGKPGNKFVAAFIGSPTMNFIRGQIHAEKGNFYFRNDAINIKVPSFLLGGSDFSDREVFIGIRPQDISLEGKGECYSEGMETILEVCELLGHRENLYLKLGKTNILACVDAFFGKSPGSRVVIKFNYKNMHIFDAETELRINP